MSLSNTSTTVSPKPATPEDFLKQIKDSAALWNTPVNEGRTLDCLKYFWNEFSYDTESHIFAYKITSKPKPDLYYRVFSPCPNRRELIKNCDHLLADTCSSHKTILNKLIDTLDTEDWIYLDFEASRGLEKIWFNAECHKLDLIVEATKEYLPPGILNWVPIWKELGLQNVAFLALDFHQKSLNVYFAQSPDQACSRSWCESIFEKAGWDKNLLKDETAQYLDKNFSIGFTFSHDKLERFCFYCLALLEDVPSDLHPKLVDFFKSYQTFSLAQAIIGRSFSSSPNGYYQKLDVSVLGDFEVWWAATMTKHNHRATEL